jgi:glyoxalase family protein
MRLEALHHITMITADAQANVDFYAGTLGLRLVKKTVNFDQPEAYHLYFGDDQGSPGSILTWFEFPGAARGRAGAGAIHLIQLSVPSERSVEFWSERLGVTGPRFEDNDGLAFELVVDDGANPPLRAAHPEIPAEHAITGVWGARAYAPPGAPGTAEPFLTEILGFTPLGANEYRLDGEERTVRWAYDPPPAHGAVQGAGSVHHIAWASQDADHLEWQRRVRESGAYVTEVRDRDYFRSIYFGEPGGVLFEIATLSPGFAVDEDPAHLGEALRLPRQHEHLRAHLEQTLVPITNPRA